MTIEESKAYEYAQWCVKESTGKVGKYVKKQAQQWIDIVNGKNNEAYISNGRFKKICKLLKIMVHPDLNCSMYEGLERYAWFFIIAIFCTKAKKDSTRYYQTALLEISRKNFKTFNSGVVFIIGMLTEPRMSRFFSVAPNLKLSKELQIALKKIIKASPMLADEKIFRTLKNETRCLLTESEFVPLAYSQDKMDGKQANIFLADEAGAMDTYPVEAMRSSQIALREKLGIIISTQYPNDNNALIDEIDIAKKGLDGLSDSKRYFALLFEPDDEILNDWERNDNVIYQSNPVAIDHEYIFEAIAEKRELAILYENKRENYLCKHNNIKYKSIGVEGFIEVDKLRKCKIVEDLTFWHGKRVFLGLDLSMTNDNTSVAMVTECNGEVYAKVWAFVPEEKITLKTNREKVDYNRMIRSGYCFACGDEVIDYGFVEEFVLSLENQYGVEVIQLGFDRYNAISSVQKFESVENPIECVEIKQHSSVLHPATKWLLELILQEKFHYDSNLLLEINFQNARCTYDTNMNRYVNKKKSEGKVDMVVSLINALYLLQQEILYESQNFGVQIL